MELLLHQLVTANADANPDGAALIFRDELLTHAQLDRRVNQLANALHSEGVRRGDRVGIFMDKCVESAVALYGIMRAGAAYVPLDPAAPVERLADILRDCGIRCVVTNTEKRRALRQLVTADTPLECLLGADEQSMSTVRCVPWDAVDAESPFNAPAVRTLESDLAYIIYTSGSTGTPKGIMHTHLSGSRFAQWAVSEYRIDRSDRLSNHAPLHFDLSILDYFGAAEAGACTVVIPEEIARMPASYSQLIADSRISILYTVPFALIQLLARGVLEQRDLATLRWIIFGGEPYPPKHLRALMDCLPHVRFDNIYGPAEVNGCSHYTVPSNYEPVQPPPIGPIATIAESLVVDTDDRDVAPGEAGELLVRTPTMMLGYWKRPELNDKAFLVRRAGGVKRTYYRTGDLVRCDADGVMEFCGRKDRQVKIRGYRVELDEVETALTSLDGVEESAVVSLDDGTAASRLHAVVLLMPGENRSIPEILKALKRKLPRYALPSEIEIRNALPRTSTGKIDRTTLARELSLEATG